MDGEGEEGRHALYRLIHQGIKKSLLIFSLYDFQQNVQLGSGKNITEEPLINSIKSSHQGINGPSILTFHEIGAQTKK